MGTGTKIRRGSVPPEGENNRSSCGARVGNGRRRVRPGMAERTGYAGRREQWEADLA